MSLSKDKKYYFKRGVFWLLLATIVSFGDDVIRENISNSMIRSISTVIVFANWLVFLSYCIKFNIKAVTYKWFS